MPQDQITYGFTAKLPGPVNYSSVSVNVAYTSSVKDKETPEAAFARVKAFVESKVEKELNDIASRTPKSDIEEREAAF